MAEVLSEKENMGSVGLTSLHLSQCRRNNGVLWVPRQALDRIKKLQGDRLCLRLEKNWEPLKTIQNGAGGHRRVGQPVLVSV